jgi:feruloyl esterase
MAFENPKYDWREFNLDRDLKVIDEKVGFVDSNDPDLTRFKANGGKLLLYQGWRDLTVTPEGTISYYDSVLSKTGPNQPNWIRLFMAPGMGHCGSGPGVNSFDTIGALEKWREEGIAPDRLTGRNNTRA